MALNKLTNPIMKELRDILSPGGLRTSPEDLTAYGYDAYILEGRPDAVALPDSTDQVARVMKLADIHRIPVYPRGAGSNLSGAAVARAGGIVLCLTHMDRILKIDKDNRVADIEPGVVVADLQKAVEEVRLFYPPDPGSQSVATMGGAVMMNAGGMRGVKYGVTHDYLLGLEVVLPTGEVMETGSRMAKNVAGYDLTHLICGSEGTLAVATRITVRLLPKPEARHTLQAFYPVLDDAARTVAAIISAGIVPCTLELMDRTLIRALEDGFHLGIPTEAEAVLLIEVDGEQAAVGLQAPMLEAFCRDHGAHQVQVAGSAAEREQIWAGRRSAFGALARIRPTCIIEDATVPVSLLPDAVQKIQEIAGKYHLQIGIMAHAGDGNLHPTILVDERDRKEMERMERAFEEIVAYTMSVGGVLSGEHGIGSAKRRFLQMQVGSRALEIMRGIKQVLDPKGILNPGSFLDEEA